MGDGGKAVASAAWRGPQGETGAAASTARAAKLWLAAAGARVTPRTRMLELLRVLPA